MKRIDYQINKGGKEPRKFTNKQTTEFFFACTGENAHTCRCRKVRKQNTRFEYNNLMNHINEQHPNYQTEMENCHHTTSLSTFAVSKKAENVFSWVKWVTIKGLPFSFVEDESTRQFSKLEPISKQSLLSYMKKITVSVEESIKAELPSKFGIVIDGWSDMATSTHYFAIFG